LLTRRAAEIASAAALRASGKAVCAPEAAGRTSRLEDGENLFSIASALRAWLHRVVTHAAKFFKLVAAIATKFINWHLQKPPVRFPIVLQ